MIEESKLLQNIALYSKGWYRQRRFISDEFISLYYDREKVITNNFKNNIRGIWWDLAKIMEHDFGKHYYISFYKKDGLGNYIPDKENIVIWLIKTCERFFSKIYRENNPISLLNVRRETSIDRCWYYGYYVNYEGITVTRRKREYLPQYDPDEALVWYLLSILRHLENKDFGKLDEPDYKNVLPRANEITDKKIKEIFK